MDWSVAVCLFKYDTVLLAETTRNFQRALSVSEKLLLLIQSMAKLAKLGIYSKQCPGIKPKIPKHKTNTLPLNQ